MLNKNIVSELSRKIKDKRIGIIGDFCLDIYWYADMTRSELSRETPHYPLPVVEEKVYLGAGGNVASNIAALCPGKIYAMSLYGNDWRGMLMKELLEKYKIDPKYFVPLKKGKTNAYCKPMRKGISAVVYEDPRLDFENMIGPDGQEEELIISNLLQMSEKIDVLCVADQFRNGIVTEKVRNVICDLAKNGLTVIADSRYHIADYKYCILKPNEVECWKAVYGNDDYLSADLNSFLNAADTLAKKNNSVVFCTLGANGSYITEGSSGERVEAKKLDGELDICGAGDTSLSAFSCALACGTSLKEAASFAALASSVTVKKIGITGTADFDEILLAAE